MKTAISIPDPIFEAAESLAKQLGLSRSELYTRAVMTFIETHRDEDVTKALDQVYAQETTSLDPVLEQLQLISLSWNEW